MPGVTHAAEKQNISLGFLWLCSSEVTAHVLCPPLNSPSLGIQQPKVAPAPESGATDVQGFIWGLLCLVKMKQCSKLLPALSACSTGGMEAERKLMRKYLLA